MSMSNGFENSLLELYFKATAIANVADNASSSPLTNIYLSLHVADPGEGGAQNTNECSYGSYARVAVARTGAGWVVTTNSCSPAAAINFPACTSGTQTATHFGIGRSSSGAGTLDWIGTLAPTQAISTGVTPQLTTTTAIVVD